MNAFTISARLEVAPQTPLSLFSQKWKAAALGSRRNHVLHPHKRSLNFAFTNCSPCATRPTPVPASEFRRLPPTSVARSLSVNVTPVWLISTST